MKTISYRFTVFLFSALFIIAVARSYGQPLMETGGQKMLAEWIDKETKHKVVRLTRLEGNSNISFYFHNNPFIENKMVFYSSNRNDVSGVQKQEISTINSKNKQIHLLDLSTLTTRQMTFHSSPMNGEIVQKTSSQIYYQVKDSIFSVNAKTGKETLEYVFPPDFKATITSVNADGTLLGGAWSGDKEKELLKNHPDKKDYFDIIYAAKLPRTLFTINIKSKQLNKIFTDSAWLNHVQFSPTDPALLMFCHEGPWHKVDRIWTIDVNTKSVKLIHKRTMDMEIAGHEFFSKDGRKIWFDLQLPRGETFYLCGADLKSGREIKYQMTRDEWSIHFNVTRDEKMFCGDGGNENQVARAKDGRWIYLFHPAGDKFISEKLVNMKNQNYKLEPNVHFSPDEKWVIFRANFEGEENVYAVEINKSKT